VNASGRSQRRPAFRLLTAGIAVGIALVAGAAARADDPETLRDEADSLSAENAALAGHEQAALLELYALEARLRGAERKAATLRSRGTALERQERSARGQLAVARSAEAAAQKQLGERIRALYVEGEADPISIIFGASSLDDAIDAIDGLSRLAEEDDRIAAQVKRTRVSLRQALRSLTKRQRELRALSATAEAARASLARARDEKAGYLASLARQRRLNVQEIQALKGLAAEAEAKAEEIQTSQAASPTPGEPAVSTATELAPSLPESPSDSSSAPGRQVAVSMTMYCLRGYTATGIPVGPGVVATDPSVIPLGTRMYIPGYGEGVAADTGGAVIGLTIDAWVASCGRADEWGRRPVTITIYD
jgi:3D (Asp-Asp-Asp) domain-containing protein